MTQGPGPPRGHQTDARHAVGGPLAEPLLQRDACCAVAGAAASRADESPPTPTPSTRCSTEQEFEVLGQRALRMQVLLSCCIMFAEGFYATQLFPYGASMTEELRGTATQAGLYTGFLYTAQSCGTLMTGYVWGRVSNRYGRRMCLLIGLSTNMFLTIMQAISRNYWMTAILRLTSGLFNSNLAITRTSLRESFQVTGADDTWAFSALTVAFAASSMAGPSLGGLLYGVQLPLGGGLLRPWSVAMLACTALYLVSFTLTALLLPETWRKPTEAAGASAKGPALLRGVPFVLLLVVGGGHSYVFTGWELVYPLLARVSESYDGEQWTEAQIGITFLVGSCGLILYSTFLPILARKVTVIRIWCWSWVLPILAFPVFPRVLAVLCHSGPGKGHSAAIVALNYGVQIVISVFIGSGFVTIQLLLNDYVSSMPGAHQALALANGMLVSTQALVRAISPISTGALFTLGFAQEEAPQPEAYISRALAFDSLALVGFLSCVCCAAVFARLSRSGAATPPR